MKNFLLIISRNINEREINWKLWSFYSILQQEGRGKVIVMELCTGGSLFNILDDPENSHGLEEPEYLLVLKHLGNFFLYILVSKVFRGIELYMKNC